jgi:heme-degrading monooxygenase HmoA
LSGAGGIAQTPEPPYFAVIFTSLRAAGDDEAYGKMSEDMMALAAQQPGYLGVESARDGVGITVSYWRDLESIRSWKRNADHLMAQREGRAKWYDAFTTRIARVERDYSFER